jgi:hypothetical protein
MRRCRGGLGGSARLDLSIQREPEVAAGERHGSLVGSGEIVALNMRHRPKPRIVRAEIGAGRPIWWQCQEQPVAVARGRKRVPNVARWGQWIAIRHLKWRAIGHEAAGEAHGGRPIPQGIFVQLATSQAVRREERLRQRGRNAVLYVPALGLKVVLGEVHALAPQDLPRDCAVHRLPIIVSR